MAKSVVVLRVDLIQRDFGERGAHRYRVQGLVRGKEVNALFVYSRVKEGTYGEPFGKADARALSSAAGRALKALVPSD